MDDVLVPLVVIGLIVWRVVYAIRHAMRSHSMFSRWTDPWTF
jgi:hypothetical protein